MSRPRNTQWTYECSGCGHWTKREFTNFGHEAAPKLCRVDDGVANRVDRTKAIGNGQVPAVAALAWKTLMPEREGGGQ